MSDYPRMVYHADGSHRVVGTQREQDELGDAWGDSPSADHHTRARLAAGAVDGVGAALKSDHIPEPHHLAALRAEIERQVREEFVVKQAHAAQVNAVEQARATEAQAEADKLAQAFDPNPDVDPVPSRRNRS